MKMMIAAVAARPHEDATIATTVAQHGEKKIMTNATAVVRATGANERNGGGGDDGGNERSGGDDERSGDDDERDGGNDERDDGDERSGGKDGRNQ